MGVGRTASYARLETRTDRKIGRVVPSTVTDAALKALVTSLDELVTLLEPIAEAAPRGSRADGAQTSHALYLQMAVDLMTDAYILLRGVDAVKRTTDGGAVRGE